MIRGDLSARKLAELTCREGDLYPVRQGRPVEAEEGIARQRELQQQRLKSDPQYEREVSVNLYYQTLLGERKLSGRIDGMARYPGVVMVEEIKCRSFLPDKVDAVDRGQARIYAGMLAMRDDGAEHYEVKVVYVHVETLETVEFLERLSASTARAYLQFMLLCLVARLGRHYIRNQARMTWAAQLQFPMPTFRAAQQAVARRVYGALMRAENLLLEAPTGSGKSLAVLFPAIKAQQLEDQLFFLTSRNAGAQAALTACQQLDVDAANLVVVELTAKDKMCFVQGVPCNPEECPYAAGYYDRAAAAVNVLLTTKRADRAQIEAIALEFSVCPFELSLDLALWADVIVGDYNYVLDPVVRLKRFADHKQLHLLVDEAHQLSPRVRDMLTVRLDRQVIKQAKQIESVAIQKRVDSIDRAMLSLRRQYGLGEHVVEQIESLQRACHRLLETVAKLELELAQLPELVALYFAASRWVRSDSWVSDGEFIHVLDAADTDITVSRVCLDAGPYLQSVFDSHAGVVRFSGTVTPLPLYQRLHGQQQGFSERAQNPFRAEQTAVLVVRDIATYFNQRQTSLPKLVQFLLELQSAKPGRYLVALPSFAYLQMLVVALTETQTETQIDILAQSPGLSQQQSNELLDEMRRMRHGLICIVMGGVLGESVDFTGISLQGVVSVGLGLPPPSLERDLLAAHFEQTEGQGWGQMVAYTQPALVKNLQAAGRLIRSPDDFGVICLVDPRFSATHVQRFFPDHWQPRVIPATQVGRYVKLFWNNTSVEEESGLL